MATVFETFGVRCPKCEADTGLIVDIKIESSALLLPEGDDYDGGGDHEWGPENHTRCAECGWEGKAGDCSPENEKAPETRPASSESDDDDFTTMTDDEIRAKASELYADDDHQFDEDGKPEHVATYDISHAETGAWVRGWFWVPYDTTRETAVQPRYTELTKPCNDCPFRRNSLPGWLGPWDPTELVMSLKSTPFPCHQTIPEGGGTFFNQALRGCAGAAIFLNNHHELSRAPETHAHQQALRGANGKEVFDYDYEFVAHHQRR